MANLRRSLPPPSRIMDEPARRPRVPAPRWIIAAGIAAAVLFVAWWDGGEEAPHPIAQPVDLPGDAR